MAAEKVTRESSRALSQEPFRESPPDRPLDLPPDLPAGAKARQIVDAARRVFMAQGYGAASMDAIAREAGVSKATVYAYFPSKEALFAAIIGGECRRRSEALWSPEGEIRDVRADLLTFARCYAAFLLSDQALSIYRLVVAEAPRFPELGRIFYESGPDAALSRLASYFEKATARGLLRVPDPRLAAEQLIGMIRGAAYLRRLLGIEAEFDERELARVAEGGVEAFLGGYGPKRDPKATE